MYYNNLLLPGVYFYNSNNSTNYGMQGAPIFCSLYNTPNLADIGCNDTDEKVLVFPGFKIELWTSAPTGTPNLTIDNTNGTTYLYKTGTNGASTCKIYYNNQIIENCMSTTGN
jgi:hypothetical protein